MQADIRKCRREARSANNCLVNLRTNYLQMRLLTERQVQLGAWSPLHDWERRPGQIIDRGEELSVCYWHSLTVLDRNFEKTNVLTLQQLKSPGRPNQKDIFSSSKRFREYLPPTNVIRKAISLMCAVSTRLTREGKMLLYFRDEAPILYP